MRLEPDASALSDLETLFDAGALGACTDGQLLERFATDAPGPAAEAAFALLVERHGAMVHRACCSVGLGPADADDAMQATFLLLARRARTLWVRASLAPWLHAVALRTGRQARRTATRRARHEQQAAAARPSAVTPSSALDPEFVRLLHAEIDRLPDRFRRTVILCDLESCPLDEAARRLGCAVGTVKSRLSRARVRLRSRLVARGLAPAIVASLAAPADVARAGVATATSRKAALHLARAAARPWPVHLVPLIEGASRMLVLRSLAPKAAAVVALAASVGLAAVAARAPGQDPGSTGQANPPVAGRPAALPDMIADFQPDRIVERGRFVPARIETVANGLDREATIASLLRPGTMVKKGDVVARLDVGDAKDEIESARVAVRHAMTTTQQAEREFEIAEIAVKEYLEALFPMKEQALEARTKLAETVLLMADDAQKRLTGTTDQRTRDEARLALQQAEFSLLEAKTKLSVLREYTKIKQLKTLQGRVESARNRAEEGRAVLALAQSREARLRGRIEQSEIRAPIDGMVAYPTRVSYPPEAPVLGWPHIPVDRGTRVRPGQAVVEVHDELGPLVIETLVKEVYIDRVEPGQAVTITAGEGDKRRTLAGMVEQVSPVPTHAAWTKDVPGTKRYAVRIRLRDELRGMRNPLAWTGTTQVEIATPPRAPKP